MKYLSGLGELPTTDDDAIAMLSEDSDDVPAILTEVRINLYKNYRHRGYSVVDSLIKILENSVRAVQKTEESEV